MTIMMSTAAVQRLRVLVQELDGDDTLAYG
jgi:hypothetical protein